MFSSGKLIQRVLLLHPRLDGLVEEEVGAPGAARRHHVGRHSPVQASHSLRLDDGGHRVTDGGVLGSAMTSIIHGKSGNGKKHNKQE